MRKANIPHPSLVKKIRIAGWIGLVLLILYASLKGIKGGNDINVYLHAGSQLLNGEDIYGSNPFNRYLYSPFFAILMAPLSALPWAVSRVIWALLNIALSYRCYLIIKNLIPPSIWNSRADWFWNLGFIFISFNAFNHNLILGQMTVIILWMTLEGLQQIFFGKEWKGASLLALGMNIKIIPALAIFYIFFKGKYRASFLAGAFLIGFLLLPSLFIGFQQNIEMHSRWLAEINPSGDRYAWEDNTGCISLNCILPTYFLDKDPDITYKVDVDTVIADLGDALVWAIQGSRILVLVGLLWLIYSNRRSVGKEGLVNEWSLLLLASLLIFPHQMKYSMLYATPAILILWMAWLEQRRRSEVYWSLSLVLLLSIISALMGRDIIGHRTVDILDHFRFMGLAVMSFYIALLLIKRPLEEGLDSE
jgi:hypothetical protein